MHGIMTRSASSMCHHFQIKRLQGPARRGGAGAKRAQIRVPWWPSGLERYAMARREVRGSNPALGILFARIKRLFYQFAKLLSLREIRGCFYRFATKRRWISRGGSLFKIINDCINVADEKDCRIR